MASNGEGVQVGSEVVSEASREVGREVERGTTRSEDRAGGDRRIPVSVLTGFLGAGKTTLLNHLLHHPDMAGAAVLINEFGEVGIDHHLVGRVDETMLILDSGCICCSVQGDLVKALRDLAERSSRREIPPVSRVVIETTGLADPVPVVYTLTQERFVAARYRCDGVITAVAATHAVAQLDRHGEAVRQVAMADRLLITKGDLAAPQDRDALDTRLAALNPSAERFDVAHGQIDPALLFGGGVYSAAGKLPDVARWLGDEQQRASAAPNGQAFIAAPAAWRPRAWAGPRGSAGAVRAPGGEAAQGHGPAAAGHRHGGSRHDPSVRSFVVTLAQPVPWQPFALAMGRVLQTYGAQLLRVKGLVNVVGDPAPRVIHCVQDVAYPPLSLPRWPADPSFADRRGRLVFITHDLPAEAGEAIRAALGVDFASVALGASVPRDVENVPLPTLCWLGHGVASPRPSPVEVDGFIVQPRRLRAR